MARKQTKRKTKAAKSKGNKRKSSSKRKPLRPKKPSLSKRPTGRGGESLGRRARIHQGVALESGGQSGDIQGLSKVEDVDSESVTELAEEGQAFEAGIVDAVENVPNPDEGPLRTEEVPEDDVQPQYRDYRERES